MSKPVIEITVDLQGNAQVETKNVVGASCKKLSAAYEQALGIQIDESLKPEYYQGVEEAKQKVQI